MITISTTAQEYFRHLLEQQGEAGMGLRLQVLDPGTAAANCDLQFCPPGDNVESDQKLSFDGFDLFVADASRSWLERAEIDFDADAAGGQLTIKAPDIKGRMPGDDAPLPERIGWLLETTVNPQLASHGGRVALVEVTEAMEVVLQFGGGCHGCGMADVTLKQGIEKTLKSEFPEITGVLDVTDHASGENPYYRP